MKRPGSVNLHMVLNLSFGFVFLLLGFHSARGCGEGGPEVLGASHELFAVSRLRGGAWLAVGLYV